ncbi:cyclic nucleotide-binding domain-containing protein [Roseofilum casamattae]|uniref:Cyclic nucleotide-binding domain-containing protein n=1 Tax=Roseofilum casamattae BLCC-M143 TaxID=3022442 RepID=A0ABT7BRT5_9CYAN|nr:cyclic nucleotide-binding domain-containing protein [Roseofilum casamattae]MDJ1181907.1 cyclic nucleotide-binding domain-containing protein [Roseofilum casamattae BLCC-M143]
MLEMFEILANFTTEQLETIECICERKSYGSGDYLVRQGDRSTELYFIIRGAVELYAIDPNTQDEIDYHSELHSGESFGGMSFFDSDPRSCSIRAKTDTEVYCLSRQRFLLEIPNAMPMLNTMSTTLLQQINNQLRVATKRITALQRQVEQLSQQN